MTIPAEYFTTPVGRDYIAAVCGHDRDCHACHFEGGSVTADIRYCVECDASLGAPYHYKNGRVVCAHHGVRKPFYDPRAAR